MLRLLAAFFVAIWAQGALAELLPLEGGDQAQYEAAEAGDPFAMAAHVMPVLNQPLISEEQAIDVEIYLTLAHDLWSDDPDNAYNAAWAATNIAWFKIRFYHLHEALAWSEKCLAHLRGIVNRDAALMQLRCFEAAGVAMLEMSRYEDARQMFGAAISALEGPSRTDDLMALWRAGLQVRDGTALDGLKRHRASVEVYLEALEVFTRLEGADSSGATYAILNIGAAYWWDGQPGPARDWSLRGLPLIERHEGPLSMATAAVRINLGLIAFDLENYDEAMNWAVSVLPAIAASPEQSLSMQRWNFELLRKLFLRKGQTERAILFGKMAVNAQQEFRKINKAFGEDGSEKLRAEWSRLYSELADLLIGEGRFSEAQAVLNMEKEQEAFEFLQRDASAVFRDTEAVLTDAELSEHDKLMALATRPVEARLAWQSLNETLSAGGGTQDDEDRLFLLEDAMAEAEAQFALEVEAFLSVVEAERREGFARNFDATGAYQAILREKDRPSAILQLALLDDATHLFLTLPGATVHERVAVGRAEMRRRVFAALQAIEGRQADAVTHLQGLQEVLFAPIRDALDTAGIEVVMINADDVLRYVPFAALHDGQRYLVEEYAFALYVAAVQTQFDRPDRIAQSTAGFGVTQAHAGFDALPGVAQEIETLFTADDGRGVLEGQALLDDAFDSRALRRTLRRPPQLLHIASHFALRPGQDNDSFLLMGDGSRLPLSELRSAKFRFAGVDLLTLSACQTARGGDGSEIDGFGAAALNNGASAVMASLWPVADNATPVLMRDFYVGLLENGLDKAEALRRAQIAMLQSARDAGGDAERAAARLEGDADDAPRRVDTFDHPYFWSPFVLMGNWL